jgi:MinD superfamily P-loop ATPase
VDCDVDAADLHLLLNPEVKQQNEFWSGYVARIDPDKCIQCGLCLEQCRFDAIVDYKVDPVSCEGCCFCSHICPVEAIKMEENLSGHWFISETKYGSLVHARLGIAQENSGKLVAAVRQQARKLAEEQGSDYIISDGPPGIGCPVISSLSGVNLAVIITEPTVSGIHDLERVIGVCRHFNVPVLVCINKYSINEENTVKIEDYCKSQDIKIAAKITYDNVVTEALMHNLPVVEYSRGKTADEIQKMWEEIEVAAN